MGQTALAAGARYRYGSSAHRSRGGPSNGGIGSGKRRYVARQTRQQSLTYLWLCCSPQQTGFAPDRFLTAVVRGAVALMINYLLPEDPEPIANKIPLPRWKAPFLVSKISAYSSIGPSVSIQPTVER